MERQKRAYVKLSAAQVEEVIRKTGENYMNGTFIGNRPPFTKGLAGRELSLCFDNGVRLTYTFVDEHRLTWKTETGKPVEEYYDALESDEKNVFLLQHIKKSSRPQECIALVIDMNTSLVAGVFARIGTELSARDVARDFIFGAIERKGEPLPTHRYRRTTDLVGKIIAWNYIKGEATYKHIYISDQYFCYIGLFPPKEGWADTCPADYFKINDHLYIFSWVEELRDGVQGLCLINTDTLHDVGGFFGINKWGRLESYLFGAIGEYAEVGFVVNKEERA